MIKLIERGDYVQNSSFTNFYVFVIIDAQTQVVYIPSLVTIPQYQVTLSPMCLWSILPSSICASHYGPIFRLGMFFHPDKTGLCRKKMEIYRAHPYIL